MTAHVFGVEVADAPEGYTPVEVIVLCLALNPDGNTQMFTRYSEGLNTYTVLGMLNVATRTNEDYAAEGFEDDDEDGPTYP